MTRSKTCSMNSAGTTNSRFMTNENTTSEPSSGRSASHSAVTRRPPRAHGRPVPPGGPRAPPAARPVRPYANEKSSAVSCPPLPCWPKPTTSICPALDVMIAEKPLSSMVRSPKVRPLPLRSSFSTPSSRSQTMSWNPSVEVHVGPKTNRTRPRPADELIVSDSANQGVVTAVEVNEAGVPVTGLQDIVALAAIQIRETGVAAEQKIVARPSGGGAAEVAGFQGESVVAVAAIEHVEPARAAVQRVVTGAALQGVAASQARDVVVARETEDLVVAVGADQRIVPLRPGGDEVRGAGEIRLGEVQHAREPDREVRVVELTVVVAVRQEPGVAGLRRVEH